MSLYENSYFFVLLVLNIYPFVSSDGVNLTVLEVADRLKKIPSLSAADAADVVVDSPVFKPAVSPVFSLNLLSSFPEDLEISDYCSDMLHLFGQRYVACVNCLVPAARPVKVCQNCFSSYGSLVDIFTNISSDLVSFKYKVIFTCFNLQQTIRDCLCKEHHFRPCLSAAVS